MLLEQGITCLKQDIICSNPYFKLLKRRVICAKMHIFDTKRCTSFVVKDVHLFLSKIYWGILN